MAENVTLSTNQRKAIAALMATPTIEAAAETVGLNSRTLYRYLDDPAFVQALRLAEGAAIDAATRQLLGLQTQSVQAIVDALNDPDAGHRTKLRAAQLVLDYMIKLRVLRDTEERLASIERKMAEAGIR